MNLTPMRRIVLMMVLIAIPWFMIGVFGWMFLVHAHAGAEVADLHNIRVAVFVGALFCFAALWLFHDSIRQKQNNPLLVLFACMAVWYLYQYPLKLVWKLLFG